jgi:choline dehydrogenase-like flavoprotein
VQNTTGYKAVRALSQQVRGRQFSAETLLHMKDAIVGAPRLFNTAQGIARGKSDIDCLVVIDQLEQAPDPNSRITLSNKKDRFGNPFLKLDWRIGAATRASWARMHQLVAERLKAQGIGRLESPVLEDPAYEPTFIDMRHPSGTTRMGADPATGVVDTNCRVYGIDNLYISGSSVFPTVGHANPTLTILALAIRLADHLKSVLAT